MPRLARTGNSVSPILNVCWPISGAGHGVAGARMASTSANSLSTSLRYQRRNFCALVDQRSRQHGAGDQPVARRRIEIAGAGAQPIEMQARRLAGGDDVGGRARALGLRYLDVAIGAERRRDAIDGINRFGAPAFEIAAGDRDAQPVGAAVQKRRDRLDRRDRRKPDRARRSPAWRHRRSRDRACCAPSGRHDRGLRRTEMCRRG